MNRVNLREKPYHLSERAIGWVENTLQSMSVDERIKQLIAPIVPMVNSTRLAEWVAAYQPGAVMFRPAASQSIQEAVGILQSTSRTPLLVAANLEDGGNGLLEDGTYYGNPLQVAATGEERFAYKLGEIAGQEASKAGANWAFAPIVDIDYNWRNPITNTRTFGSDPERVLQMARGYKKGFESSGGAVSVKHFPGDGMDERDQHLHVTFNTMSVEQWHETYGAIYRELIQDGAHTVMIGHIAFPAYSRSKGIPDDALKSATMSPELLQDLLRGELEFNGMITTDATPMVGFSTSAKREQALPESIAAGCDMILFTRNYEEDLAFIKRGFDEGIITSERLEDAVRRILGVKASISLHEPKSASPVDQSVKVAEYRQEQLKLAEHSITLVRDREGILPLSPAKQRKLWIVPLGLGADDELVLFAAEQLKQKGFRPDIFHADQFAARAHSFSMEQLREEHDAAIFLAAETTRSNRTQVRLSWHPFIALNSPWFALEIPTVFVSLANPYHLIDVPYISTYINAYANNKTTVEVLVEKLTGAQPFLGVSPVDPYCGNRWDLHLYD